MENIDVLIDRYPDIENTLEDIRDSGNDYYIKNECFYLKLDQLDEYVKIHFSQLEELCNLAIAEKIPYLSYLGTYGIKYKNYYEICTSITNPKFFLVDSNQWNTKPLRFKINQTQFEISPISQLLVLLTETLYSDNNIGHVNFKDFASVKMIINDKKDYQEQYCKALYYLNSGYLKKTGYVASLFDLHINYDEGIEEEEIKNNRIKILNRKDFISIEPLNLYNEAVIENGFQKFLYLYRVLEFFMTRAILTHLKEVRYNEKISESEILNNLNIRDEQKQLINLLEKALTSAQKQSITRYALKQNLIKKKSFNDVCVELYKFRNSNVHAKEKEITSTYFPNPFQPDTVCSQWIEIVEIMAKRCVKKYNSL